VLQQQQLFNRQRLSPLLLVQTSMRGMHVLLVGAVLCGTATSTQLALTRECCLRACLVCMFRALVMCCAGYTQSASMYCMSCALQSMPSAGPLLAPAVLT
jgi:hypothetical protein